MKKILLLIPLLLATAGCTSLFPKKVEFFQDKVKPVPVYSESALETQKQAAAVIAIETRAVETASLTEQSSTNVTVPAHAAAVVAQSLSTSLGPPVRPYTGEPTNVAAKLDKNKGKLDEALDKYAKATDKDAGKKIEGTGKIQIGYFTYIGLILLLGALVWLAIRVYGMFNPVVGTAAGAVGRVSSSVLSAGFSELVSGGQTFLNWVENSSLTTDVKDWITNTFKLAHQTAQAPATQAVVDKLTTPATSTSAPLADAPIVLTVPVVPIAPVLAAVPVSAPVIHAGQVTTPPA